MTQLTSTIPQVSEHELLRAAREAVDDALMRASTEPHRWGDTLLAAMAQLAQAFERHRDSAEAPGGTLELAVQERPALGHSARRQKREHVDILADIQAIRRDVGTALSSGQLDSEAYRWRVGAIQDAVRRHMARGNDLLYEAFLRDDGGEG